MKHTDHLHPMPIVCFCFHSSHRVSRLGHDVVVEDCGPIDRVAHGKGVPLGHVGRNVLPETASEILHQVLGRINQRHGWRIVHARDLRRGIVAVESIELSAVASRQWLSGQAGMVLVRRLGARETYKQMVPHVADLARQLGEGIFCRCSFFSHEGPGIAVALLLIFAGPLPSSPSSVLHVFYQPSNEV